MGKCINIDTSVSVNGSVFMMGPDQVLYKNEEVATVGPMKALLEDYIKLQTRVADIDLLPGVGKMAREYGGDKYGFAECVDVEDLQGSGFNPGPVVTKETVSLISLNGLHSLDGSFVFEGVQEWQVDLPSLQYCCTEFTNGPLTAFTGQLPNLLEGMGMFANSEMVSWDINLASLVNGREMFMYCFYMKSFSSQLVNLVNGTGMFQNNQQLEQYEGGLASLLQGESMFSGCKLNKQSVSNIAAGINYVADLSWETLDEGVKNKYELAQEGFKRLDIGVPYPVAAQITTEANIIVSRGWDLYINGVKYEPVPPNA